MKHLIRPCSLRFACLAILPLATGLFVTTGCQRKPATEQESQTQPRIGNAITLTSEMIARNNRGAAFLGQFQYDDAMDLFTELVKQNPQWAEAGVNLAIAQLNADQLGKRAEATLTTVLQTAPDHIAANYCMALVLIHGGQMKAALPHLEKVYRTDPADAYVTYLLGTVAEEESKDKAMAWYNKTIELDPLFRTAYYRRFDFERLAGRMQEALQNKKQFDALNNCPTARTFEFKYTRMGSKAMAIVMGETVAPSAAPPGPAFAEPKPLVTSGDALQIGGDPANLPNITSCDVDADGRVDLFLASARKTEAGMAGVVLFQQADGSFRADTSHPLAQPTQVTAAVWGDFNGDGLPDVYLCRRGPNQMWRQTSAGKWEDVTQATNTAGGDFITNTAAAFDADHDGDLDLFLVRENGPNELLNNNRDGKGTFSSITEQAKVGGNGTPSQSILAIDLDQDLDLDLIVLKKSPPHEIYRNDLQWKYTPVEALGDLRQSEIAALAAGDPDGNGRAEIFGLTPKGLIRWTSDTQGTWQSQVIDAQLTGEKRPARLTIADINGDGIQEIIAGRGSWQVVPAGSTAPAEAGNLQLSAWALTVLDAAKGPSLVGVSAEKGVLIWPPSGNRQTFLAISLANQRTGGTRCRSNFSGVGSKVELRVGSRWTILDTLAGDSGPGQSIQPLVSGIGTSQKADFVSIQWPDGVAQIEMDLAPGFHKIDEVDRLPSSCPVLFAWNGKKFEFISDMLGVGGLGYMTRPGQYAPPDPTESLLLPNGTMAELNRRYHLKFTEPMQESTYLDEASLTAYDLPPDWHVTLDERLAVKGPEPTGEPRFYRRLIAPVRAIDQRGANVVSAIAQVDRIASPVGELDPRFVGRLAEEQTLTLEFNEPLPASNAILVGDGWVEFPYSQTAFAAWQAGERFTAPSIEARGQGGGWVTVCEEFGYPGGMPREISVPLTKLPPQTTALRIRGNLEIYWDRLAVAQAEPCPQARVHHLPLLASEIGECGFIPRQILSQQRPAFEYEQRVPFAGTRDPAGFYTRFGAADELIGKADNALAIIGPGEQVSLEFESAPPCPTGWNRCFVFSAVGWCKDMDLYTEHGATVEPLPHRGSISPRAKALNEKYNTRYQNGR